MLLIYDDKNRRNLTKTASLWCFRRNRTIGVISCFRCLFTVLLHIEVPLICTERTFGYYFPPLYFPAQSDLPSLQQRATHSESNES